MKIYEKPMIEVTTFENADSIAALGVSSNVTKTKLNSDSIINFEQLK